MNASSVVDMVTKRETAKRVELLNLLTQEEVMTLMTLATEDHEETDTETIGRAAEEVAREGITEEVQVGATAGAEDEMKEVTLQAVTTGEEIEKK